MKLIDVGDLADNENNNRVCIPKSDYENQAYHALGKIRAECEKLLSDKRLGTVSRIDVPIQDIGEYELILTLKLK